MSDDCWSILVKWHTHSHIILFPTTWSRNISWLVLIEGLFSRNKKDFETRAKKILDWGTNRNKSYWPPNEFLVVQEKSDRLEGILGEKPDELLNLQSSINHDRQHKELKDTRSTLAEKLNESWVEKGPNWFFRENHLYWTRNNNEQYWSRTTSLNTEDWFFHQRSFRETRAVSDGNMANVATCKKLTSSEEKEKR